MACRLETALSVDQMDDSTTRPGESLPGEAIRSEFRAAFLVNLGRTGPFGRKESHPISHLLE